MRALAGVAAKEALRSKLVLVVAAVTLAVLAGLAWSATGDGTPQGRLRAFVGWGSTWIALTLSVTTVFLSSTLALALKDGRLVQVTTGPLRRELVPVAWWLGHAAVLAGLVAGCHLALGGLALALRATSPPGAGQVLQARALVRPRPPDAAWLEQRVAARLAELRRRGELRELEGDPERVEQVVAELEAQLRRGLRTVPPGRRLQWDFRGLPPAASDEVFTLLFSYQAADARGQPLPSGRGPWGRFALIAPEVPGAEVNERKGRWPAGGAHELPAPAWALYGRPRLVVEYENVDPRPVVVTFPEEGPTIAFPAGGFGPNLARAALVLLGRLLFLAAVGVGAAALIDGKLAALATLFLLAVGSAHGFLTDALAQTDAFGAASGPIGWALSKLLLFIPDLGREDLPQLLAGGLLVEWSAAGRALLLEGILLGGLLLGCAALLFGRRELGVIR